MPNTHQCPGPSCERVVPATMLACRKHWFQVPKPLRDRVWAAYGDGEGIGTDAHAEAVEAAIETMTP